MSSVPFPPTKAFVEAVRTSSRRARESTGIKINEAACESILLSPAFTSTFQRLAKTHGFLFPLKFKNAHDELNFISILSVLNFCSGYRATLHGLTGRGAFDSIRALVFGLYLSSADGPDLLSASSLKEIGEDKVAELMNINILVERPHETLHGVTVGERGGRGYEVVKLVTGAMNSTGDALVNGGYPDLGAFVIEAFREGERARNADDPDAELNIIVERLVRAIPALQDMAIVDGEPVYCFKKAMILVHGAHLRFGQLDPPPFPVPNTSNLPIYADNVIPSMLVHLGALDLSQAKLSLSSAFSNAGHESTLATLLAKAPKPEAVGNVEVTGSSAAKRTVEDGPVLSEEQAFALRAAAIDVCEYMVNLAKNMDDAKISQDNAWLRNITLPEIDAWLWAVAKDRPDYRALDRFVLRDTVFF